MLNNSTAKPFSNYSLNCLLNEDNKYNYTKVYAKDIFISLPFSVSPQEENQINIKKEEEKDSDILDKKLKQEMNESEKFFEKISWLKSKLDSGINGIKLDMELDKNKKEEIERQEKIRKEIQEKNRQEMIRKRQEQEEKERQERLRREQIRNQMRNQNQGLINVEGLSIKEKLIQAGNNYQKIYVEMRKFWENKNLFEREKNKIIAETNEKLTQLTAFESVEETAQYFNKSFKIVEQSKSQELYLYLAYNILSLLFKKLNSLLPGSVDNEKYYTQASFLSRIKSKTLENLFFQRVSNLCPYVIPVVYKLEDFGGDINILRERLGILEEKEDLNEVNKRLTNYEYIYFIYLLNDKKKYKAVVEDYVNNLEKTQFREKLFFVGGGFRIFLNIFGNDIKKNENNEWNLFPKLEKVKEKIITGLKKERDETRNYTIKNIDSRNIRKIEECFLNISKKRPTEFIESLQKFMKIKKDK